MSTQYPVNQYQYANVARNRGGDGRPIVFELGQARPSHVGVDGKCHGAVLVPTIVDGGTQCRAVPETARSFPTILFDPVRSSLLPSCLVSSGGVFLFCGPVVCLPHLLFLPYPSCLQLPSCLPICSSIHPTLIPFRWLESVFSLRHTVPLRLPVLLQRCLLFPNRRSLHHIFTDGSSADDSKPVFLRFSTIFATHRIASHRFASHTKHSATFNRSNTFSQTL